jgi:hypothetical protein
VVRRTRSPSRGSGSTSFPGNLHESSAIRPPATRSRRFSSVTVEAKKSPWMKPTGAADRAPDGFLPLAAPLPFVIATVAVEVERNDLRQSRAVAEKAEVMGRMGA